MSTLIADGLSDNTSPSTVVGLNSDRNERSATSSSNAAAAPDSILDRHSTQSIT
ncbi:MAG TPA: hypothetical protein VGI96_12465 [Streptosporangiaceae bacterium]